MVERAGLLAPQLTYCPRETLSGPVADNRLEESGRQKSQRSSNVEKLQGRVTVLEDLRAHNRPVALGEKAWKDAALLWVRVCKLSNVYSRGNTNHVHTSLPPLWMTNSSLGLYRATLSACESCSTPLGTHGTMDAVEEERQEFGVGDGSSARRPSPDVQTVPELLAGYASALAELRRRGVVRSANAPAGDYGEWLVAKALGGTLADNFSVKSWDVRLAEGDRIQVKTRLVSVPPRPGQIQTSPFRSWDFEVAAFVLLRSDDYSIHRATLLPRAVVKEAARWRAHVNGHVVMMSPAFLGHPEAKDITRVLRAAAER